MFSSTDYHHWHHKTVLAQLHLLPPPCHWPVQLSAPNQETRGLANQVRFELALSQLSTDDSEEWCGVWWQQQTIVKFIIMRGGREESPRRYKLIFSLLHDSIINLSGIFLLTQSGTRYSGKLYYFTSAKLSCYVVVLLFAWQSSLTIWVVGIPSDLKFSL